MSEFVVKTFIRTRKDAQAFNDVIQFCYERGINLVMKRDDTGLVAIKFSGDGENYQWLRKYVQHKHKEFTE